MKQADRKLETRRRILDAAREVFFREEFVGTSIEEISSIAEVSKGAIYRHFGSKAGLYVKLLGENAQVFLESANTRLEKYAEASPPERLRELWLFYLDHWTEYPDHFRIFWAIDNQSVIGELPTEVADAISRFWTESLAGSEALIRDGIESGDFIACDAWQISHALWTITTALIEQDSVKVRRAVRQRSLRDAYRYSIEVILRGILADSGDSISSA